MKKILIILIISLVFVLPVMADDFDDDALLDDED